MSDYQVVERPLLVEEYRMLRRSVGWNDIEDVAAVATALASSLYTVCVETADGVVAAGRVVGDGGVYAYIQDVIVLDEHRGRGLAGWMDRITEFIDRTYPPGAFVGLMAARGVAGLYERYGFERRPEEAPGMFRSIG